MVSLHSSHGSTNSSRKLSLHVEGLTDSLTSIRLGAELLLVLKRGVDCKIRDLSLRYSGIRHFKRLGLIWAKRNLLSLDLFLPINHRLKGESGTVGAPRRI